nr:MAG TPA: hypothetical protein [Caudoviricetes sp.]
MKKHSFINTFKFLDICWGNSMRSTHFDILEKDKGLYQVPLKRYTFRSDCK